MSRPPLPGGAGGRDLTLSAVRHQWEEGARRLAAEQSEPVRYRALAGLVDVVADELRRKVGQTFTLGDLADAYQGAEDWVRDLVVAASPAADSEAPAAGRRPPGFRDAALVQDAAFAQYARGASDYRP